MSHLPRVWKRSREQTREPPMFVYGDDDVPPVSSPRSDDGGDLSDRDRATNEPIAKAKPRRIAANDDNDNDSFASSRHCRRGGQRRLRGGAAPAAPVF